MAASSSSPFFGIREEDFHIQMRQQQQPLPPHQLLHHHNQQQQQVLQLDHQQTSPPGVSTPSSSTAGAQQQGAAPQKKRRNVPGNQTDPDAEVIALSPKTLLATNRFICEVCNKGFQREQNLQLHRRGHNLPWKLKQKSAKDAARRKVYLCPEPTCVHHEPSRALGDLTGIKKHYCRKHGEKKWKCDKCSKRYAVQSDWKAHSKTCGTREYRCDCGTLFSRRDSFITHRAFCDALAQESVRLPTATLGPIANMVGGHQHLYGGNGGGNLMALSFPPHMKQGTVSTLHNNSSVDPLRLGDGASAKQFNHTLPVPTSGAFFDGSHQQELHGQLGQLPDFQGGDVNGFDIPPHTQSSSSGTTNATMFNLRFFSNSGNQNLNLLSMPDVFTGGGGGGGGEKPPSSLFSGNLIGCSQGRGSSTLYNNSMNETWSLPQMSATALLQKAAQMGSTMSCGGEGGGASGLLRNFGSSSSSSGRTIHYSAAYGGNGMRPSPSSQMDNEAHLDDLMNSLVGNTSHGGAGSSREQEAGVGFGAFRGTGGFRTNNVDDTKLHNTLTRDFLGVGAGGGIMRGGGGMPQREQRHLGPTGVPFDQDGKGGNWSMYGLIPRSEHQVE